MSLPAVQNSNKKSSNTVAERVAWMSRTSDVFGSHLNTDLESYLTLIRRKIQEKCSTTQDLIYQIRRNKVGESAHVTPNEFRFTLIKFGIILSQNLVDRVFNVFDSDRSGTMDFDEFAMWIMNSEFRPVHKDMIKSSGDPPEEVLRRKILGHIQKNPNSFAMMKKQVNFFEFVSDINRLNLSIPDKEARGLFLMLDPYETGVLDSDKIKQFIFTGQIEISQPNRTADFEELDSIPLAEAMIKVSGPNTKYFEGCFAHIPAGKGVRMPFEEFRRCLVSSGMGKNMSDTRRLFSALGGKAGGGADIDLLRQSISSKPYNRDDSKEVVKKEIPVAFLNTGRVDRRLRDAFRKSYKEVVAELEAADKSGEGYIDAVTFHDILVRKCIPLTYQDFRLITQQLKTKDGGSKVNYHHFCRLYNPSNAPHALELAEHARQANFSSGENVSTPSTLGLRAHSEDDISIRKLSSDRPPLGNTSSSSSSGAPTEMRKMWQNVLKDCHRSDPERSGNVSRNSFIAALDAANDDKSMTAEAMNKLADDYTRTDGLIDYLACFRTYLNGMVSSTSNKNLLSSSMSALETNSPHKSKSLGALHPWEFNYPRRERHQDHPYWFTAASNGRSIQSASAHTHGALAFEVPSALEKNASSLSLAEKEQLLGKYDASILNTCSKCYSFFLPFVRDLKNEFKKAQVQSQKGCIIFNHFAAILEKFDIKLSKSEMGNISRSFRGLGMPDVIRYDEFMRVCLIVKRNPGDCLK